MFFNFCSDVENVMDCSRPPLGPPRNLNKHGGCELCASAGSDWLMDVSSIMAEALQGWSRPWLMTFRHFPSHLINNHNSSRIIITETYPGFPSFLKMMNETRAMMNCDKKKWARGSDLFYLELPPTLQTEILGNVCTAPPSHIPRHYSGLVALCLIWSFH